MVTVFGQSRLLSRSVYPKQFTPLKFLIIGQELAAVRCARMFTLLRRRTELLMWKSLVNILPKVKVELLMIDILIIYVIFCILF